jgi:prophage antirepressor-like protein
MLAVIGSFEGKAVRTVENFHTKDGTVWEGGWVLADVCACLEIENSRNWSAALGDDEKGVHILDTLGGRQELVVISEPGLYRLLARSRKPEAERFD